MKIKKILVPENFFIALILLINLIKLLKLDGGFVLGEPDERNYVDVVRNLRSSPYPQFDGTPFLHSLPAFHYLALPLSFIFPVQYLAVRLVSWLAGLLLSLAIYWYLKEKFSKTIGLAGAIIFSILPLAVFYTRLGLLESLLSFFVVAFIFSFDKAVNSKSEKWAAISGIFLAAAVLTKYTALPFIALPVIIFAFIALGELQSKGLRFLLKLKEWCRLAKIHLITLLTSSFVVFPPIIFIYSHDPLEFRTQLRYILSFGQDKTTFTALKFLLPNLSEYLSWPILILFIVGLAYLLFTLKIKKIWIFTTGFLLISFFVLRANLIGPRYFMILTPFVAVFAAITLGKILEVVGSKVWWSTPLVLISTVGLIFPSSWLAIESTHHDIIERVGNFVKEQRKDEWVFSNYWPSAFVDTIGTYKITWLSGGLEDSNSLSGKKNSKYQSLNEPSLPYGSLSYVSREGGFVILEEEYSKDFINASAREGAAIPIKGSNQPIKEFEDYSPNYPFSKETPNKIFIYKIAGIQK